MHNTCRNCHDLLTLLGLFLRRLLRHTESSNKKADVCVDINILKHLYHALFVTRNLLKTTAEILECHIPREHTMKYEKCHIVSDLNQKGRNLSYKKHFLLQNSVKQSQEDIQYYVSVFIVKATLKK